MARRTVAEGLPSTRTACRPGIPAAATLLDFDLGALLLEGCLDLVGLVPGDAVLDGLRCRVDEVLGLLETEPGELADDLDDGDLVRADLGEDGGELGLLLLGRGGRSGGTTGGRGGAREGDGGGGGDAEPILELGLELGQLEDGHLLERLEQLVRGQCGHGAVSPGRGAPWGAVGLDGEGQAAASPRLSMSAWTSPTTSRRGASNRPAVVDSGATMAPTASARSVSRDGSAASRVTLSASMARDPRTPPVIRTILYGRVASRTAFAVVDSSVPKAIAVGPTSSGDRASLAALSCAAMRIRRFFTTR